MRAVATITALLGSAAAADATEIKWPAEKKGKEPVAQRTTIPKHPVEHKPGPAPVPLSRFAAPGRNSHYSLGYIGGDSLRRGTGPGVTDGTFGSDYVGFGRWPHRIFLKFNGEGPHKPSFIDKYEQDGRRLPGDPIAEAPFKKAIREAKHERAAEKAGEGGGH